MDSVIENLYRVLDGLPGNYMVFGFGKSGLQLLHHTCDITTLTGIDAAKATAVTSPYDIVLDDDKEMIRNSIGAFLQNEKQDAVDLLFRMIHAQKGFIWIHMTVRKQSVIEGNQICVANLVDSTKETMIAYALMDASDRYICVIEKSSKRILYGNDKFFDLIDSSAAEAVGRHCYEHLCKVLEMRGNDNCLCYSSLNADPPIETYNPDKKKYLTITGREVIWGEYDAYAFYMTDITEKKQREAALEDMEKRFEAALANSNLMVWEYDIANSRCIASQKALSNHRIPLIIENYPESLYTMGHTPPETVEQIKECKRRLLNGETGFSVERRTIDNNGESEWQKVEYTLECDESGKPIRAIVCGLDITKQKELEAKYEEQVEYRNRFSQNSVLSVRLDLQDDRMLNYTCSDAMLEEVVAHSANVSSFLVELFSHANFEDGSEISRKQLTKQELTKLFELGQTHFRAVYRCFERNKYMDLNLYMDLNPVNKHLEVSFVIADITDNVLKQKALSSVASEANDFVVLIDTTTGSAKMIATSPTSTLPEMPADMVFNYDQLIMEYATSIRASYETDEDFYLVSEGMKLDVLQEKLKTTPAYDFSCKTHNDLGEIHTFRMRFTYLDEAHNYIIYTRTDITAVVYEERIQQEKLENALYAAKEASHAKTDFLARMSHDIRTPMNAIIGLTALSLDEEELSPQVRENLTNIRGSSDFLLGLVNDILDMSKIESGAVVLKKEPYYYTDFLAKLKAMFEPQCKAKNITFEFEEVTLATSVMVDRLRLDQIFFNLLSNAVKFTPEGGTISYYTENIVTDGETLSCDYVVKDTGIGMSPGFLHHVFEPFVQEDTEYSANLKGTGLGLAIAKSLTELMGGSISVESKENVGTKITVHLSFALSKTKTNPQTGSVEKIPDAAAILTGKRILLVEDHPLNAQIARKLLEKNGMIVVHAENGKIAVDDFASSSEGTFAAILMDIRMPVMDGLEAAKAIRSLDRPDARSVPIIAMSANAYQEDIEKSIHAGMNDHLPKPVTPERLYAALQAQIKN